MIKSINTTLSALVAFIVWGAVLLLGAVVAFGLVRLFLMGGLTVYALMRG